MVLAAIERYICLQDSFFLRVKTLDSVVRRPEREASALATELSDPLGGSLHVQINKLPSHRVTLGVAPIPPNTLGTYIFQCVYVYHVFF